MNDKVFRIEVQADGYATLYNLEQPEGNQIEIIGPMNEVFARAFHLLWKRNHPGDGKPVILVPYTPGL